MVKDDRIGHSHRFGGKINSAFRGTHRPKTLQPNQASYVVGEILEPDARRRPYKPDAANQRPAHVAPLCPEDMLYPDPKP